MRIRGRGIGSIGIVLFFWASASSAQMPKELEPDHSEAVLAYSAKRYAETLSRVTALIKKSPKTEEFLELRALTYKAMDRDADAVKAYQELQALKTARGRPVNELAPYAFEIGLLLQKIKEPGEADKQFKFAVTQGFNVEVASLYLGVNAFSRGDYAGAKGYFETAERTGVADIAHTAQLYLGYIALKQGRSGPGLDSLRKARSTAKRIVDDKSSDEGRKKLAQLTIDSANQAMRPYSESQFFASVTLTGAYDSNVLFVASGTDSSSQASGKDAYVTTLGLSAGYLTPSSARLQLVPSYRGSINQASKKTARSSEYVNNAISIYLNVDPISRFGYGFKVDGSFNFRNEVDTTTDKGLFKKFYRGLGAGPYVRFEPMQSVSVVVDGGIEQKKYFQDSASTQDSKRSGLTSQANVTTTYTPGNRWIGPMLSLGWSQDDSVGRDYFAQTLKYSVNNKISLHPRLDLTPRISHSFTKYPRKTGVKRQDHFFQVGMDTTFTLYSNVKLLQTTEFADNNSTDKTTYGYKRFVASLGVSVSF